MEENILSTKESIIEVIVFSVVILIFMSVLIVIFFRFARKKIIEKEQEKAALEINHQKRIIQATIQTQEEERQRIAKDLHDDISAKLNVVSLNTNVLLEDDMEGYAKEQTLKHILKVTNNVLKSSREIAHNLMPAILEKFGLTEALVELCDEFSNEHISVKHHISYEEGLSKDHELHVFRITQELLNNSVRHGEATEMSLEVGYPNEKLQLTYKDNGKGFDVSTALKKKGLGLSNLKSRADILCLNLSMESTIGKGAEFIIS
jgi:signal transduction histidine kinase